MNIYRGALIVRTPGTNRVKIKSSRSPEAELHDFYNNYIKKYITLQLDLTEDKNTEVKIL
jgi:hypothetical protein